MDRMVEIFENSEAANLLRARLPYLFQLAEIDCSRAHKVGMEVGSLRERILIAFLINHFGKKNVQTEIPITEHETDVKLFNQPVSIKTITGAGRVKMAWTVDRLKSREFLENYKPKCAILLVHIRWGCVGGLFYIPLEAQTRVFKELGRARYLNLPKEGTNPRGVDINPEALLKLISQHDTRRIDINWQLSTITNYSPYDRWLDHWNGKNESQVERKT